MMNLQWNTALLFMPFSVEENLSKYRQTQGPHTYADCCLTRRQPNGTVYQCIFHRQRWAARQLLFVEDNARTRVAVYFQFPSF
jgi:hypothetical protein